MDWVKIFPSRSDMEKVLTPGQPRLLAVRGLRICLVRWEDQLRAVSDTCTHNGESLSKGSVNYLGEVICPWHGHRFNLKTGRECGERSGDLVTYPVRMDEEGVFIGL